MKQYKKTLRLNTNWVKKLETPMDQSSRNFMKLDRRKLLIGVYIMSTLYLYFFKINALTLF